VLGDGLVAVSVVCVADDEDEVETGQDGGLEVDVLAWGLEVVVAAEDRVGGGEHTCAGVEDRGDSGFGDRDGLLFHGFVDGYTIFVTHLVELVDADSATICENHGTTFEVELPGCCVALHGGCQTSCTATLS
jgi:hypothetical protein